MKVIGLIYNKSVICLKLKHFSIKISRKDKIKNLIEENFSPSLLNIVNESTKHSGTNKDSETHFKVLIVSDKFKGLSKIKRHQEVYRLFSSEWGGKNENKLHALVIEDYTNEEYDKLNNNSDKTNKFNTSCMNKLI